MSGILVAAVYDDVIIATPLINQGEDRVMTIIKLDIPLLWGFQVLVQLCK